MEVSCGIFLSLKPAARAAQEQRGGTYCKSSAFAREEEICRGPAFPSKGGAVSTFNCPSNLCLITPWAEHVIGGMTGAVELNVGELGGIVRTQMMAPPISAQQGRCAVVWPTALLLLPSPPPTRNFWFRDPWPHWASLSPACTPYPFPGIHQRAPQAPTAHSCSARALVALGLRRLRCWSSWSEDCTFATSLSASWGWGEQKRRSSHGQGMASADMAGSCLSCPRGSAGPRPSAE